MFSKIFNACDRVSINPSISPLNQPSTSSDNSNNDIRSEANVNSTISTIIGSNNIIKYQYVTSLKTPPETIGYNVQDPIQSFTGRESTIRALHDAIEQRRNNGDLTIVAQTNVVSGLGGIGKTEIVRKYLQKYKSTFSHILWINAETYLQARDCLINIATLTNTISIENLEGKRKKDEDIASEVYNFICQKPAIIIFDNANSVLNEDGEEGIGRLLPRTLSTRCVKPAIIVTSRNIKWNNCHVIKLSGFDDGESYKLLIKQLQFQDTTENRLFAEEITHLCDGLPLVIQQVIGAIKMESDEREALGAGAYGMQDFINDYHRGNKSYVDERPDDVPAELGVSYTVYKIFRLAFQKFSGKDGELAVKCINIVSLLNPDGIPVDLLLSFFDVEVKHNVPKALTLLLKYNLLHLSGRCYTVHRMLQKVRIEMLNKLEDSVQSGQNSVLSRLIIKSSGQFCEYLKSVAAHDNHKFLILENGIRLANLIFQQKCESHVESFLYSLGAKFVEHGQYYNAIYILKNLVDECGNSEKALEYKITQETIGIGSVMAQSWYRRLSAVDGLVLQISAEPAPLNLMLECGNESEYGTEL